MLTPRGPVVYYGDHTPAPTGSRRSGRSLAGDAISGPRATVTQIEQAARRHVNTAGINGDFFSERGQPIRTGS